jgi:hypothetical protein
MSAAIQQCSLFAAQTVIKQDRKNGPSAFAPEGVWVRRLEQGLGLVVA